MKSSDKGTKPSVRKSKTGILVTLASVLALTIGTAGVFAFSGSSIETSEESVPEQTTSVSETTAATSATESSETTATYSTNFSFRKAGIGAYQVATAQQTTTTTSATTAAPTTTTTAAPVTTTAAATTTRMTTKAVQTAAKTAATTKKAANTTAAAKTIYNSPKISYTAEEFDMMCYVVQAEVGNCPEPYKIAVANVIINRVKSPRFAYAKSIKAVLTAGGQFDSISNYYNKRMKPNQSTINCCRRALNGEDNSNGAVYYYSPKICGTIAWFESMQVCLNLDSGLYSAKFFKPW